MQPCKRRRAGCAECRRKKARCDEKRPVCSRCSKSPKLCSYELIIKRTAFQAPRVEPPLGLFSRDDSTPAYDISHFDAPELLCSDQAQKVARRAARSDVELLSPSTYRLMGYPMVQSDACRLYLHHFITQTSVIYFPLRQETALSLVITTAENSPCLLWAIVAASCSHYFRLTGIQNARTAAIAAMVESLSTLRETIANSTTRRQSSAILSTTLMLATTCLCVGDTATFRSHLNGALHVVQQDDAPYSLDPLWWFSLKWLVHLLLMNRLSGFPMATQWSRRCFDWDQLLISMPDFGEIDLMTGLSRDLVTILANVFQLSGATHPTLKEKKLHVPVESTHIKQLESCESSESSARSLEIRLLKLKDQAAPLTYNMTFRTELECSHNMFTYATLLYLYRRVNKLPKTHTKVQLAVEFIIFSVQKIDKYSDVNIQLLWPLLTAGCEATTDAHRSVIVDRMMAMTMRGLGSYSRVLQFMRNYWENGADGQWDVFARQIGMDLVLF